MWVLVCYIWCCQMNGDGFFGCSILSFIKFKWCWFCLFCQMNGDCFLVVVLFHLLNLNDVDFVYFVKWMVMVFGCTIVSFIKFKWCWFCLFCQMNGDSFLVVVLFRLLNLNDVDFVY